MLVPHTDVQSVDELRRLYRRTRSAMRDPANAIGSSGGRQGAVKAIAVLPDPGPPLRSPRARCGRPDWGSLAMLAMLCQVEGPPDSEEDDLEADSQPVQLPRAIITTLADLRRDVCRWYGISLAEFKSPKRPRTLSLARQEFFFLAYKLTTRSHPEIARYANRIDHTTTIHGIKKHKERLGVRTDDSVEFKWA